MDAFYERLVVRAATIDELLSDDFEPLPGQKGDTDLAARRLAAWCRSCASGDWSLFARRLGRDGLTIDQVLTRLATVRRKASAVVPAWIEDAIWIERTLQTPSQQGQAVATFEAREPYAFEDLLTPVVGRAEALLWAGLGAKARNEFNKSACASLRGELLGQLSELCAPLLYARFAKDRKADAPPANVATESREIGTSRYDRFAAALKAGGFRHMFEHRPVLLRLIASLTRQWIDTSRELVLRLDADLPTIRRDILNSEAPGLISNIEGGRSDPHNKGHSVQIISFEDGSRIVYKPKDLRPDLAWHSLIKRLNRADPPVDLKAPRVLAQDGYGWSEFIDHVGCADRDGFARFFRRAGAWLALFHCFVATDMHHENMVATGEHPVPIDLEMILQAAAEEEKTRSPAAEAFEAATEMLANTVMMVGLLPAYLRSPENNLLVLGGLNSNRGSRKRVLKWNSPNTDEMRPAISDEPHQAIANLPHVHGQYARLDDYIEDFVAGFRDYAKFLLQRTKGTEQATLFDGFSHLAVRKVIHPSRFYHMLLQRLKNHSAMDDGAAWSAQADFTARLADWEKDCDPVWPLQRAERSALLGLNVPHFLTSSDGADIGDASGALIQTASIPGVNRARARVQNLDAQEIAWQIEVIQHNMTSVSKSAATPAKLANLQGAPRAHAAVAPIRQTFAAEADRIAGELSQRAIRRGPGAAWIGLDWLTGAETFQLACLGPDLYNGISGIAVFLAAHALVTGSKPSAELALAAVAHLRQSLRSRNAARIARSMGVGGATGLGSIVYALTAMSKCLDDADLLADAHAAAELYTDDLIAADKQLDVVGGSAGAILGLLRLFRDTQSADVLDRATKCGEHLMAQSRIGPAGCRSWVGQGFGPRALNGMSHGAAGFAFALASLSAASGCEEFARAAAECIAFEDASYDAERNNWPDWRGGGEPSWPCQWCHGAAGIGLARIATTDRGVMDGAQLAIDIRNAVDGVNRRWPGGVDTLCCGTLGTIEFLCAAGAALLRSDLRELAAQRLIAVLQAAAATGDYRWNGGEGKFNLGLFRGLAGVGYTLLRRIDGSLPNVLIWE